ncbi:MAG: hypothetical protein K2H47_00920 [Muribaculaceae bacterium]|nr:hypothetical protein [Muribaculaceae bacterium]
MIPGLANVLSCPFCGGKKEVMNIVSGNTSGLTVWSDTRRRYPMLPEVSPIQQCPHCKKYYFTAQAKREYSKDPESGIRSFGKLGELSYLELKEAKKQMESLSLTKMQRWILNHQSFMAYNDTFRRYRETSADSPSEEDEIFFKQIIEEMLEDINQSANRELLHAELLRETGRFDEARKILVGYKNKDYKWIVDAMLRHIESKDIFPFLLVENGSIVK